MSKRLAIFLLPLMMGIAMASAVAPPPPLPTTDVAVGEQIKAVPVDPPSQEVNYVEESELTRKMVQAQKAHDARKYDSYGGGITIIAMCIVIGALIVLSILFYFFGRISSWFITHKKKQSAKALNIEHDENSGDVAPDSGVTIAAIAAALADHFATDHDMEDTILTIRRMRKAYSPWNSKIYNMRHLPEVAHNHPKLDNNR